MITPENYTVADGFVYAYSYGEFYLTELNEDGLPDWDDADKLDWDDPIEGEFIQEMINAARIEGKIIADYWAMKIAQQELNELVSQ